MTMSSQGLGQNASFLGDQAVAMAAAARLFSIVDRRPKIDSSSEDGATIKGEVQGRLEFKNISFAYPARPEAQIFKDFNLTIEPGQTVALVGASGSGKSTGRYNLSSVSDTLTKARSFSFMKMVARLV